VEKGDKRMILVDGEPVGAINRVPPEGETRSNMHVGGRPEKIALSDRDREICARIGPLLRDRGLIFTGIDVIGDWLTEINVTSPTGIQELERFDGTNVAGPIWEAIEARVAPGHEPAAAARSIAYHAPGREAVPRPRGRPAHATVRAGFETRALVFRDPPSCLYLPDRFGGVPGLWVPRTGRRGPGVILWSCMAAPM
jgi:hypothetical protein